MLAFQTANRGNIEALEVQIKDCVFLLSYKLKTLR
jgi:hypothetical protein